MDRFRLNLPIHHLNCHRMSNLRPFSRLAALLGVVLLSLFLSACERGTHFTKGISTSKMSTFDTKGEIAHDQLGVFEVTLWVCVALFVLVGGAFLYVVVKFKERPGETRMPEQEGHGNPLIELGLIAGSIFCLVLIAIPTVNVLFHQETVPAEEKGQKHVEVDVYGWQWWWSFEYKTEQGTIVTANELTIPEDTVVILNLRGQDVIHSFWLPKIAGKTDLIPGRLNQMWIKADKGSVGHYYGQCAEYCGEAHAYMLFRANVLTKEDFNAWKVNQLKDTAKPAGLNDWADLQKLPSDGSLMKTDPVLEGARLVMGKGGCVECHTFNGTGANGPKAPNLTHVASRTSLAAGLLDHREFWGDVGNQELAAKRQAALQKMNGKVPEGWEGDFQPDIPKEALIKWVNEGKDVVSGTPGKSDFKVEIAKSGNRTLDNLYYWVRYSEKVKPGNLMNYKLQNEEARKKNYKTHELKLTDSEFRSIAAFLQTLK